MRKIYLLLITVIISVAQVVAQKNATVVQDSIQSNILGTTRNYSVILPPGYKENPDVITTPDTDAKADTCGGYGDGGRIGNAGKLSGNIGGSCLGVNDTEQVSQLQ